MKQGKLIPGEVTVKLLQKAMEESRENDKFLIDGFPRNFDNRKCFETATGIEPQFVLFFDCPEDEMERRVLGRNQIDATRTVDEVFSSIEPLFQQFKPDD